MATIKRSLKRDNTRIVAYFLFWFFLVIIGSLLNACNVDWKLNSRWLGVLIVLVVGVLQGSVLELVAMATTTAVLGGHRRRTRYAPFDHLTLIMNYNLLAVSEDDVDETFETMFKAYMKNLSENFSIVLVSATNSIKLKQYELQVRDKYRLKIYKTLMDEGLAFANNEFKTIDKFHIQYVWLKYVDIPRNKFLNNYLDKICRRFSKDFMCVHRVSRVLKKCGQYQDLMLLSEGDNQAYSYTDQNLYGKMARPYGEELFYASKDVKNILGRCFDYTLVLDGDTGLSEGSVYELMSIAAAYPDRGIVQPAIKMDVKENDSLFMHLEDIRQQVNEPINNAITELLGQSGFFGKGLIQNKIYIENVIGNRHNVLERVPIDVLSHDTFEAACLRPLYASSVLLLEAPCLNYVTWDMRETRWNKGEILLSMYFWPFTVGTIMRYLQSKLNGIDHTLTKLRTQSHFDFVSAYVAHSALRNMFMKPLLLAYMVLHMFIQLHYPFLPICTIMFLILIYPKMAVYNGHNFKNILIEVIASTFQFTPEAFVGTWRVLMAIRGNLDPRTRWVPQRAAEEEFRKSNPFKSSFRHLWMFSLVATILSGVVTFLDQFATNRNYFMYTMIATLFLLPLFTAFTTMTPKRMKPFVQPKYFLTASYIFGNKINWYFFQAVQPVLNAIRKSILSHPKQQSFFYWETMP